jgi:hypothetical protein
MHQLLLQMCRKVKQMNADSVSGATFQAIKGGVIEFIIEIGIKVDPRLLYTTDEMGRTIYIFLHCPTSPNAMDTSRNITILHMAVMLDVRAFLGASPNFTNQNKNHFFLFW